MRHRVEEEASRHAGRRADFENIGRAFRRLRRADPRDLSIRGQQPDERETRQLRLPRAPEKVLGAFVAGSSIAARRAGVLTASAVEAAAAETAAATAAIAAASTSVAREAAAAAKAAARRQPAARVIPHLGAIERLGAFGIRAGKSGDLASAVLVGELEENVEVAVDDLIGTGGTEESAGDLQPLDGRKLVVSANGLARGVEQCSPLGRILRGGELRGQHPCDENRQNHRRKSL